MITRWTSIASHDVLPQIVEPGWTMTNWATDLKAEFVSV
jgi:hypothetical protein